VSRGRFAEKPIDAKLVDTSFSGHVL
jgi:hypothetical protein